MINESKKDDERSNLLDYKNEHFECTPLEDLDS
jgi:hypothetical protein